MAVEDLKKLHQLLDKYCKLVEAGELCAGDCPNDGVSCSTGVCRAHLRYVMINKYYYKFIGICDLCIWVSSVLTNLDRPLKKFHNQNDNNTVYLIF